MRDALGEVLSIRHHEVFILVFCPLAFLGSFDVIVELLLIEFHTFGGLGEEASPPGAEAEGEGHQEVGSQAEGHTDLQLCTQLEVTHSYNNNYEGTDYHSDENRPLRPFRADFMQSWAKGK